MTSSGAGDPGRRLGRYHLAEPVGGGPTGEVYRARISGVAGGEARYAVKVFAADLMADPARAERIAAAVRTCGKLEHPRVQRVRELGTADGVTFAATDFIEGADASRLIAAGGLPLGATANLIVQACRAIGYAHGRGLVHLGVCPTNLLVTPGGEVQVTDFGLLPARLSDRPAADPALAARVHYLAPEQLGGGPTSPATDVFCLGVVAYELWTGQRPFRGGTAAHIAHAIQSEAPAPTKLPKPFAKVLARALARSPFERFPDAGAMADAIELALRASPAGGNAGDAAALVVRLETQAQAARPAVARTMIGVSAPRGKDHSLADTIARDVSELLRVDGLGSPRPDTDEPTELGADDLLELTRPGSSGAVPLLDLSDPESGRHALRGKTVPPPVPSDAGARPRNGAGAASPFATALGIGAPPSNGHAKKAARAPDDSPWADGDTPLPPPMPYAAESQPSARLPLPPGPLTGQHAAVEPAPVARRAPIATPPPPADQPTGEVPRRRGSSKRWLAYGALFSALAVGSFLAFDLLVGEGHSAAAIVAAPADAGTPTKAAKAPAKAAKAPAAAAAVPAVPDAAVPDAPPPDAATPEALVIDSDPPGAKVYVDGALIGKTPQTLDGSTDSHRLALILPGYELHTADIAGAGEVRVKLEEVTPPGGPAGIKVRCRHKNRYYVFVDGIAVGQLCPTERIGVEMGPHVVEIYDPVTDSRRVFRVRVKETRLSLRVRVD